MSAVLLLWAAAAPAASVRTIDGKLHEGTLSIDGASFVLSAPPGTTKIDPSTILSAYFRSAPAHDSPLPAARWANADVGTVKNSARTVFEGNSIAMAASGLDVGYKDDTTRDDFRFLWQTMHGDGEVVARVVSFTQVNRAARVGVMIRDSLEAGAPNAMAYLMAENAGFQYRSSSKGETARANEIGAGKSGWLKLVRIGNTVTGYASRNGSAWQPLGTARVPLGPSAYVGLAVASRQQERVCIAKFDSVSVTPAAKPSSAVELPPLREGIILRGGSIVAGEVRSIDESTVRIERRGSREQSLPVTAVAAAVFRPLTPAQLASIQNDRTGILTPGGDFLDGQIKEIKGNRIRMSSVLFGARNYDAQREAAAAVMRKVTPAPAAYEVLTGDGSVLLANSITLEKEQISIDEIGLGEVKIAMKDLVALRAGSARFHSFTALRPSGIDRPANALPGRPALLSSAAGALPSLANHPYDHALLIAPGAAITYTLDGSARTFICHAAVPPPALPTTRVRLIVLSGGKELARTPDLCVLDDVAALTVPIAGLKSLTLKLQAADLPELAPPLLLCDPALVK